MRKQNISLYLEPELIAEIDNEIDRLGDRLPRTRNAVLTAWVQAGLEASRKVKVRRARGDR